MKSEYLKHDLWLLRTREVAIGDTLFDEEVGLYTRAYREKTRRLRSKLARSGGVIGCVSLVVIPILILRAL